MRQPASHNNGGAKPVGLVSSPRQNLHPKNQLEGWLRENGDTTLKTVFIPQPFENSLRRMTLLSGTGFVSCKNLINEVSERIKLRAMGWLISPIAWGRRMPKNLTNCPTIHRKTSGCFSLAQPLMVTSQTNSSVNVHSIHLPPPILKERKALKWRIFTPLQSDFLIAPVAHYCSGIYSAQSEPTIRDKHIQRIKQQGRIGWQQETGYGKRSRVEAQIGRWKTVIGNKLMARTLPNQKTEVGIAQKSLNRMNELGTPMFERAF